LRRSQGDGQPEPAYAGTVTGNQVPRYLGRVLADGEPVGTCFQVAPGVLVTAWHVLDALGAGEVGATVRVDMLASKSPSVPACVLKIDILHDLAVLRDEQVALGVMSSRFIALGMSGAPVRRPDDDAVVGVVSGRYNNSRDGWLHGAVWVARVENLLPLLDGVTSVAVLDTPLGASVDLVLTVSRARCGCTAPVWR
jgi:hypothetical protein